jgi:hypothetical protein
MAVDSYACALELLAIAPVATRTLVSALPEELRKRPPSTDAWSVVDILAHLVHVETVVIRPRMQQMLDEDCPVFATAPPPAPARESQTMLDEWAASRAVNLHFLRNLTPEQLARTGRHARYGLIQVREHVIEWAYHDQDHLRQVVAIIQSTLYPDIGGFRALYAPPL